VKVASYKHAAHAATRGRTAIAVLALSMCSVAHAQPYARDKRVAHLARAIDGMTAMGDAGRRAFEIAIYDAVRARCRPGNRAAPIACLIAAAREVCRASAGTTSGTTSGTTTTSVSDAVAKAGDRCLAVADVIITNQHAETSLLDETTRMRLVSASAEFHQGVLAALEARWAVLAAELSLVSPDGTLAERIDRLCRERDREVRPCSVAEGNGTTVNSRGAPVCVGTIAYQRCAAGLVWFTSGPRSAR
jgi:hypothetical protein